MDNKKGKKPQDIESIGLIIFQLKVILAKIMPSSNKSLTLEELVIMQERHIDILTNIQEMSALVNSSQNRLKKAISKARKTANTEKLANDPDFLQMKADLSRLYQSSMEEPPKTPSGNTGKPSNTEPVEPDIDELIQEP